MNTKTQGVAVLFARSDSIYKSFSECDVWDAERDALTWPGGAPVVAHPPCRLWGRLFALSTAPETERATGFFAVEAVRRWGGVLEHPAHSKLWKAAGLPKPGMVDKWGGWTLSAPQFWWGHRAYKRTWFYICGVSPAGVPPVPLVLGDAEFRIGGPPSTWRKAQGWKELPCVTKREREATPPALARWLVDLAHRARMPAAAGAAAKVGIQAAA